MNKELTKKLLKNEMCDSCYARKVSTAEGDMRWCLLNTGRPKADTCDLWVKDLTGIIDSVRN